MDALLIKGLGLPEEGCHHTLSIYDDGSVEIGSKNSYRAIELPQYGRLIDADRLKQVMVAAMENDKGNPFYKMMYSYVIQVLAESPTVLEASE